MKRILAWMMTLLLLACAAGLSRAEAAGETGAPEESGESSPYGNPIGYVRVTTASQTGWLPVPERGEYTFPLEQTLPDGTRTLNLIHVSPEGVYMEASTCKNQDCVEQGAVTFGNLNSRVLGRYIICLPNFVMLELFTPEEAAAIAAAGQEP